MKVKFKGEVDLNIKLDGDLIYIYGKNSLNKVLGVEKYCNEWVKGLRCIKKEWGNNIYTLEFKEFEKRLRIKQSESMKIKMVLPVMESIIKELKGGLIK